MSLLYRLWRLGTRIRCRDCGTRTLNIDAHRAIDHAGDEWTRRRG